MKTTYYVTLHSTTVMRATTAISKIKMARIANDGLWCKVIAPKVAKQMIKEGAEFIKVQDLY